VVRVRQTNFLRTRDAGEEPTPIIMWPGGHRRRHRRASRVDTTSQPHHTASASLCWLYTLLMSLMITNHKGAREGATDAARRYRPVRQCPSRPYTGAVPLPTSTADPHVIPLYWEGPLLSNRYGLLHH
jgi:hypothetical protein